MGTIRKKSPKNKHKSKSNPTPLPRGNSPKNTPVQSGA